LWKVKLCVLLAASLILTACPPQAEKKNSLVRPPQAALAPQLSPLPLPSYEPSLSSAITSKVPDKVDQLLSQVDEAYASGMSAYQAGNLEQAKEEFDRALTLLLSSDQGIDGNDRLSSEFDRLVEDIHALELAALERGDTLSAHANEPAPIESFSGLTFPVDPNIKQRVQQEAKVVHSDLPLVSNDYVAGALTFLQGRGSNFVHLALKRLGIYQPMMLEILQKEGVPQDLIYLAAAESAFNPYALSRMSAKGIWQFMLSRGMEYGLRKDRWVDERQDPQKSTVAAARHLKDLYKQFGDWFLAMAAYNCGPVNVQRAIEKTGYADYWKLRELHALPVETENYVPVILATAFIAKDPKAYGFDIQPDPPAETDQVTVSVPTDLRLVAQLIDRPVEEVLRLNPSLLRWITPPNDPHFILNLPKGTKDTFEQAIASIPENQRVWWRAYRVNDGDTLSGLARRFRISPVTLAQANQIKSDAPLTPGARLVLPLAPGNEASLQRVRERVATHLYRYRVKPGDTVELIADRFDVTPYQVRRWNGLKRSQLVPGRTLRLYVARAREEGSSTVATRRHRRSRRAAASHRIQPKSSIGTAHKSVAPKSGQPSAEALALR